MVQLGIKLRKARQTKTEKSQQILYLYRKKFLALNIGYKLIA